MNRYNLAVLIPARNEQFLAQTVENVLRNKRGNTEVIVGIDSESAGPGVADHKDLTVFYSPVPLGQRGMTNQLARMTKAKWVMKLDAHCALDEGFDVKIFDGVNENQTVLPAMYNLHAFDWVCYTCGHRQYQGPTIDECPKCKSKGMGREIIWKPRMSRRSEFFRFDKTLHFQYWGDFKRRPEAQGDVAPTLSAQGSCFMLTRDKYWELNICDESLAGKSGWGQQGVEVAVKTWLSGGELVTNKKTWYAHMFRTQGGDFGFPFPISGREVEETRKKSRDLFQHGNWEKALPGRDLNWLLDKFYPVPDWHDGISSNPSSQDGNQSKNIIFYTDNQLKLKYAHAVQKRLRSIELPIVSASLKPMPSFGTNVHIPMQRGMEAYFKQIITALETSTADIVYMCEHDVLYHPSHFQFTPPTQDKFYYNQNFWRIRPEMDNLAVHFDANQVSGLVCYRKLLLDWYKQKWEKIQREGFDRSYEPGGRNSDIQVVFRSEYPNIDIRHGNNLTKSKWSVNDFRDKSTCQNWQETTIDKIPGWESDEFLNSLIIKNENVQ